MAEHSETYEESIRGYVALFNPPSGPGYKLTGKTSPKLLSHEDLEKCIKAMPDFPNFMLDILSHDKPEISALVIPNGMTANDFQHFLLAKLAKLGRPTDIFRPATEAGTPEEPVPVNIGGEKLMLKPSESFAFGLNLAVLSPTPEQLPEGLRKLREGNADLSDTGMVASGYAVGAMPTFNPRLNPDIKTPISINIGDANTTPADIQNWYCGEIQKPFQREGNDLDAKTAFTLGFIQARTDARNNFEVSGGVGITEPCPPAQTPNTGIAGGNGTSAAPTPAGGGNANKAAPQR